MSNLIIPSTLIYDGVVCDNDTLDNPSSIGQYNDSQYYITNNNRIDIYDLSCNYIYNLKTFNYNPVSFIKYMNDYWLVAYQNGGTQNFGYVDVVDSSCNFIRNFMNGDELFIDYLGQGDTNIITQIASLNQYYDKFLLQNSNGSTYIIDILGQPFEENTCFGYGELMLETITNEADPNYLSNIQKGGNIIYYNNQQYLQTNLKGGSASNYNNNGSIIAFTKNNQHNDVEYMYTLFNGNEEIDYNGTTQYLLNNSSCLFQQNYNTYFLVNKHSGLLNSGIIFKLTDPDAIPPVESISVLIQNPIKRGLMTLAESIPMQLTNNKFKSTFVYGKFRNLNDTVNNITANGVFDNDLTVGSNIYSGNVYNSNNSYSKNYYCLSGFIKLNNDSYIEFGDKYIKGKNAGQIFYNSNNLFIYGGSSTNSNRNVKMYDNLYCPYIATNTLMINGSDIVSIINSNAKSLSGIIINFNQYVDISNNQYITGQKTFKNILSLRNGNLDDKIDTIETDILNITFKTNELSYISSLDKIKMNCNVDIIKNLIIYSGTKYLNVYNSIASLNSQVSLLAPKLNANFTGNTTILSLFLGSNAYNVDTKITSLNSNISSINSNIANYKYNSSLNSTLITGKVEISNLFSNGSLDINTINDVNINATNINLNGTVLVNNELINNIPVGCIIMMPGNITPNGYLLCNGTIYNKIDYPNLSTFLAISGFNTTNNQFNVPNYQGSFLRGYGTAPNENHSSSFSFKIPQEDFIKDHTHQYFQKSYTTIKTWFDVIYDITNTTWVFPNSIYEIFTLGDILKVNVMSSFQLNESTETNHSYMNDGYSENTVYNHAVNYYIKF